MKLKIITPPQKNPQTHPHDKQPTIPKVIDYKDPNSLKPFISERGRIMPSRISGVPPKKQKEITCAIKRARFLCLLPYVNKRF